MLLGAAMLLIAVSCGKEPPVTPSDGGETKIITEDIAGRLVSIQEFGVLPSNSASTNKQNLQKAIDEAASKGLALYVTPVENGYPIDGGIVLKKNVSLIGAHGPTGRGTANKDKSGPTGSLFVIRDKSNVFITTESATSIKGIQFFYPDQTWTDPNKIIRYPATIQGSQTSSPQGVTLQDLSFYGEYFAMDFRAKGACEQILFQNCYGYPLSGQFIAIDKCYDIPRILHCHVNPANMREFGRSFSGAVIDKVVANKTYTYWIDHTDNAVMMDVFTFGNYGGIYLGENTYGQLTSFNLDCVAIGIYRTANGSKNRTWQIAQGSIIANLGSKVEDVHPIVITGGGGHTTLSAVECFSGKNGALTCIGASYDFLYLPGEGPVTVSMLGCRMSSYTSDDPVTVENGLATVSAVGCFDNSGELYEKVIKPTIIYESGTKTMMDACDNTDGWKSSVGNISLDSSDKKEGNGAISASGKPSGHILFTKNFNNLNTKVSHQHGHFHMWLYTSSASALTNEGAIEVTSSGTCDQNEYGWHIAPLGLKTGWNEVDLKLADAGVTGGQPNLKAMNYIRIYEIGMNSNITVKLDDIYFYEE